MAPSDPRKRAAVEAADRIRDAILTGRHRPGTSLPGERELSETLGVSRLTLRSALAHLEAEGLVRPFHGSGTRVLDYRESGGVDLLGYLARLAFEGRVVPIDVLSDLLELRRAVAVEAVGLTAERATPDEMRAMRAHVAMQAELLDQPKAFMQSDLAFARLVVRATHNLAFELIFNTVARTVESNASLELVYFANAPATLRVYGRLLDIVEKREGERARRATRALLERLDRTTLSVLGPFVAGASGPDETTEDPIDIDDVPGGAS
ncbi:MAG: FadR family transcriptional regulator [Myxococcota bacterium]|nr:FadR family transcriptional regulator [Myxococcota bacterium]